MKQIILIFALAASSMALAQTNKEAKKLLQDVRKTTESFKTQTITFSNELDAPTGNDKNPRSKRTTKGSAKIKGQKYRIDMGDFLAIHDGKQTFMVYPDDKEINIVNNKEGGVSLTPSSILEEYDKGYSYSLAGKETVGGKNIQYIRLKPVKVTSVKEVMIGVDTKTKQLFSYQQFGTNGVNTKFVVTSYVVNTNLDDALFSTKSKEFAGYEIVKE